METMNVLPAVSGGSKFGTVTLGYDRVTQVRAEISTLMELVSLVFGCPPESLTIPVVQKFTSDLRTRLTVAEVGTDGQMTTEQVQAAIDKITGGRVLLLSDDRSAVALDFLVLAILLRK